MAEAPTSEESTPQRGAKNRGILPPVLEFRRAMTFNAVSYDVLGDPGIKAGVEDAMQAKIGKVVGFFIYRSIIEQGSNAVFDISGMRFGRVMDVEFSGGLGEGKTTMKAIIIQPVAYYGPDIITSPHVPSTDREIGRLELVR